jgi:hypothetical protein
MNYREQLFNGISPENLMALVLFAEFHLTLLILILTLHYLPRFLYRGSRFRLGRRILLVAESRYFLLDHLRCSRDTISEFPQ